jgi:hypothetical protein
MAADDALHLGMFFDDGFEGGNPLKRLLIHVADAAGKGGMVHKNKAWQAGQPTKGLIQPGKLPGVKAAAMLPRNDAVQTDEFHGKVFNCIADGGLGIVLESNQVQGKLREGFQQGLFVVMVAWNKKNRAIQFGEQFTGVYVTSSGPFIGNITGDQHNIRRRTHPKDRLDRLLKKGSGVGRCIGQLMSGHEMEVGEMDDEHILKTLSQEL